MSKKITIILGHPNKDSLCGKIADEYKKSAEKNGHEVKQFNLGELDFDPILHKGYKEIQELEPDLVKAQEYIKWADHLVFVYPVWWGSMPAILKGLIDRIFLPGFGYKYRKKSIFWDKLLKGRSARLIMTMGGPSIYDNIFLCRAGIKIIKKGILGFCGIKPVRISRIDKMSSGNKKDINKFLVKIKKLGEKGV